MAGTVSRTSGVDRAPDPPGSGGGAGGGGSRPSRSRQHKVIGGVCGGLGRYYGLDPVVFRVPLAVLSVIGGLGFVAYGVAWLMIPFEGGEENEGRRLLSGRVEGPGLTALLFIVAGCGLMLAALDDEATWFATMVLAALAGAAYWSRHRRAAEVAEAEGVRADAVTAHAVADAPPEAQAPPAPAGPTWWGRPALEATAAERASGYLWGPAGARGVAGPPARPPETVPRPPVPAPAAGRREFRLGGLVLLLAVLAGVTGTAAAWGNDALGDALVVGLSAALLVFGTGLVVSAFAGRLGVGTIIAVVLTSGLLAGAAALPENITTTWSEPVWRPASAAAVRDRYEAGSGHAILDLSGVEVPKGERVATSVEGGAGQIEVWVPPGVELHVLAEVGVGAYEYDARWGAAGDGPSDSWGGVGQERTASYPPEAGAPEGGTIELSLEIGVGQVSVERVQERGARR